MDKKIYAAMIGILKDVGHIGKEKKNQQQGYMFRGIDDMYNALHDLFAKHEVFPTSNVLESRREERQTRSGGTIVYTIAKCEFTFYAIDGSFVVSTLEGEAMDTADKSTNKAMSTALKYALMQVFLIPTQERLDTEYDTHELAGREKKAKAAPSETKPVEKKEPTPAQFEKIVARFKAQEPGISAKIKETFALNEEQKKVITDIVNSRANDAGSK